MRPLVSVCLAPDCLNQRLLCLECIEQHHAGEPHKIISVEQVNVDMKTLLAGSTVERSIDIKNAETECLTNIDHFRDKILETINQLVQDVTKHFNQAE